MIESPGWKVLLIGGGSGTGKTELSLSLGRHFGVPVLEGDVLRQVIEAAVTEGSDPDLHLFRDSGIWDEPVDEITERTLRLSRRVCEICEVVVAHQYFTRRPLIIEGFWVLPEFATRSFFNGIDMSGRVRSLFLFEPDAEALRERYQGRDGKVGLPEEQVTRLDTFHRHGLEIKQQAEAASLPVLASQPFETLETRALDALGFKG